MLLCFWSNKWGLDEHKGLLSKTSQNLTNPRPLNWIQKMPKTQIVKKNYDYNMMSIVNRCFHFTEKGNINIQRNLSCVLQKNEFGTTWYWANDDRIVILRWTINFICTQFNFFALFGSEQTQSPEGLDGGGVYSDWSGGLLVCLHPEPEF